MDPNEILARFSEQQVAAFFLVLCRITPLFVIAPLFSSKMIPRRVKGIIAVGGDAWIIKGLARTYEAVPLLQMPALGSMVEGAQMAFSGIFVAGVMIGAPVIIAMIITDAAFGVVSRVVPQMNIFAVGFPAKMIIGLTLLGASLPFASGFIADQLQISVSHALHALKVG